MDEIGMGPAGQLSMIILWGSRGCVLRVWRVFPSEVPGHILGERGGGVRERGRERGGEARRGLGAALPLLAGSGKV